MSAEKLSLDEIIAGYGGACRESNVPSVEALRKMIQAINDLVADTRRRAYDEGFRRGVQEGKRRWRNNEEEAVSELKACFFCGGENLDYLDHSFVPDDGPYQVECNSCRAQGPWGKDKDEAARLWNSRPLEDELVGALRECAESIDAFNNRRPDADFAGWVRALHNALNAADKAKVVLEKVGASDG